MQPTNTRIYEAVNATMHKHLALHAMCHMHIYWSHTKDSHKKTICPHIPLTDAGGAQVLCTEGLTLTLILKDGTCTQDTLEYSLGTCILSHPQLEAAQTVLLVYLLHTLCHKSKFSLDSLGTA